MLQRMKLWFTALIARLGGWVLRGQCGRWIDGAAGALAGGHPYPPLFTPRRGRIYIPDTAVARSNIVIVNGLLTLQ